MPGPQRLSWLFTDLSEVVHVRDNPVRAGLVRLQKTGRMLVKLPSRPTEKKKRAVIEPRLQPAAPAESIVWVGLLSRGRAGCFFKRLHYR